MCDCQYREDYIAYKERSEFLESLIEEKFHVKLCKECDGYGKIYTYEKRSFKANSITCKFCSGTGLEEVEK